MKVKVGQLHPLIIKFQIKFWYYVEIMLLSMLDVHSIPNKKIKIKPIRQNHFVSLSLSACDAHWLASTISA